MLALALSGCTPVPSAVVRVTVTDADEVAWVAGQASDVWSEHVAGSIDVVLDEAARRRVEARGLPTELLVPDLQALLAASRPRPSPPPGELTDWPDLAAIEGHLEELAESPWATLHTLGTTHEGRPIRALEVAAPDAPADRPTILVTGLMHAREWVSGTSALYVADRLVQGAEVEPAVRDRLARWRVVVVPVVNPDGYRYTWTTDRLWRKNRRPGGPGEEGVDLNRNFGEAWGEAGSSGSPASNNYRGPRAFSEPEAAALRQLAKGQPALVRHLDLHCTGQIVLHPWAHREGEGPGGAAQASLGEALAEALQAEEGSPYGAGTFHTRLYPASGVGIDWMAAEGVESFLFELRDRGRYGFLLPPEQILPTAREVWAGFLLLTEG